MNVLYTSAVWCYLFLISYGPTLIWSDVNTQTQTDGGTGGRDKKTERGKYEEWQPKEHSGHVMIHRTASGSEMVYKPNTEA